MEKINFTNGQVPALNGTNLNQLQTNVENAVNEAVGEMENKINETENKINEVDNKSVYSTTETVIGTWINGKPIYRKVIEFGTLPSQAGTGTVKHGISNLEKMVNIQALAYESYHAVPIPHTGNAYMFGSVSFAIRTNNTDVIIWVSADRSMMTATVILEYTKTTD